MAKDPGEFFTVQKILDSFARLQHPRSTTIRVPLLGDIIVSSIVAVMPGADANVSGIGVLGESCVSLLG